MKASHFSSDIQEFIKLLAVHRVRYLIVGGEAVIYYGHARLTGDVDFFYETTRANVERLYDALNDFWDGQIPGIRSSHEFLEIGVIIQFGKPPNRIDLINRINGVSFKEAWYRKKKETIEISDKNYPIYFIGFNELVKNKESTKRFKDMEDLKFLHSIRKK